MRFVRGFVLAAAICALPALNVGAAAASAAIVVAQADTPAVTPPPTTPQTDAPPAVTTEVTPAPVTTPVGPPPLPAVQPPAPPPILTPPPLPVAPKVSYFIEQNGQAAGPFTIDQLKAEVDARRLTPQTMVWKSGDPAWQTADKATDLKPLFANLPPPIPVENQWRQYLVGTWQAVINTMNSGYQFTQTVTTQFRPDGTFVGVVSLAINGQPGSTQPIQGTWKVQAVGGEQFTLTEEMQGEAPATVSLRRVDQNTVANDTENYQAQRIGG